MGLIVGVDASRNRSGGAKAHLIGILSEFDPAQHGIESVHVWAFRSLLDQLPENSWLVKHNPSALESILLRQLWWQAMTLTREVRSAGCDVLFTTDASTLCRFSPMVALSQDMLSYEPGVMQYFGYGLSRLRLLAILAIQNLAFRRSEGVIFLTRYAGRVIQKSCGALGCVTHIPHGVDAVFRRVKTSPVWSDAVNVPIRCIYVSNAEMYKHQWLVVEGISLLRNKGFNITLDLIGGGTGPAQKLVDNAILEFDPDAQFVQQFEFLPHSELPGVLAQFDIFIFASSCENMPVTLVEAMAVGLPIACSNRGPMPEVLEDGGVYFDPENPNSIAAAVEQLVQSPELRTKFAGKAKFLSEQYNWKRCSDETFTFIEDIYKRFRN